MVSRGTINMGRYRAGIRTSADITGGTPGRRKGGDKLGKENARSPGMVRSSAPEGKLAELLFKEERLRIKF